jgi:DNA-binding transcriptional regulator YhcF (GntR family)
MDTNFLTKLAALFAPSTDLSKIGLTDELLADIGKQNYTTFASKLSDILFDQYKKNPEFKKTVDNDINKKTDRTIRELYKILRTLPDKVENPEVKQKLTSGPSIVATKIFKSMEEIIKRDSKGQYLDELKAKTPLIKTEGDLTQEELKAFGVVDGNINTLGTDEDFYNGIMKFEESPFAAGKGVATEGDKKVETKIREPLSVREKDALKFRFKSMYERAKGLQKNEVSNYEATLFGYSGLNDIKPILDDVSGVKKNAFYSHINSLLSSRKKVHLVLGNEIKKDLVRRLYKTLENRYAKPEDQPIWLKDDVKNIEKLVDHWVEKPLNIEFFKEEQPQKEMTPEERIKIKEKQETARKEKKDDPGRTLSFAVEALVDLSTFLHVLESDELNKVFKSAINTISEVLPSTEDINGYLEAIQNSVYSLDIAKEDIPVIFKVEEYYLKPDIKEKLQDLRKNSETLSKEIVEAKTDDQKKELAKKLVSINKRMKQLLKLDSLNLDGIKELSENYLTFLKNKNKEVSDSKNKMIREINILNKVQDRVDRLRKNIVEGKEALFNKSFFRTRWNSNTSDDTTSEVPVPETETMEKKAEEKATESSGLAKYKKIYNEFREGDATVNALKTDIRDDLKGLFLKLLSFLEIDIKDPLKSKSMLNIQESEKGMLMKHLNSFKWILDKYGVDQDFTGNPLAGRTSNINELSKKLKSDFDKLKRKLDVSRNIKDAQSLIEELTKLDKFIVAPAKKETSVLSRLKQAVESAKELLKTGGEDTEGWKPDIESIKKETLTGAETKIHKLLSETIGGKKNIPFYDLVLSRKKETKTGPRKLPNFFQDDSNGFVKIFIEHLAKENINKAIEDPSFDVSKHINEAIEKTLKTQGGLGEYLANTLRRDFEQRYDLKKLYKEMQEIDTDIRGLRDTDSKLVIDPKTNKPVKAGVSDSLEELNKEILEPIHQLIDFITNPLEKLVGKVKEERKNIPEKLEKAQERKNKIRDFLQWAKDTKDSQGINLLERVMYGFKGKIDADLFKNYKNFIAKNKMVYQAIKENKTSNVPEASKKEFLTDYQQLFGIHYPNLPSFNNLIEDVQAATRKDKEKRIAPDEHIKPYRSVSPTGEETTYISPTVKKILEDLGKSGEKVVKKVFKSIESEKADQISALSSEEKQDFLNRYQELFGIKHEGTLPTYEQIVNEITKLMAKGEKDTIIGVDLIPEEKEFLNKFNALTGRGFKSLPSPKDIQDQLRAAIAKPEDIVGEQAAREKGLSAIKDMPEELKKNIKKIPKDFWEERWYKNLLRTRGISHSRWFEEFISKRQPEIENEKEARKRVQEIKKNISNLLTKVNSKTTETRTLSPERTISQLEEQKNRLNSVLKGTGQKSLKEFASLRDFSANVITPLKTIEKLQAEIEQLVVARYILIREMQDVRGYFEDPFMSEEEKTKGEDVGKSEEEKKALVGELSALLKGYDTRLQGAWDEINRSTAKIIPHINIFVEAAEAYLTEIKKTDLQEIPVPVGVNLQESGPDVKPRARQEYEKSKYYKEQDPLRSKEKPAPLGMLPWNEKEFLTVKNNITEVEGYLNQIKKIRDNLEEEAKKQLEDIGEKEKDIQETIKKAAEDYDPSESEYDVALKTRPSREETEEEKEQGKGFVKGKPELYAELEKTLKYFNDFARGLEEGKRKTLKDLNKYSGYFNRLVNEKDLESDVSRLREEIIPGLKKLLKEEISIKGTGNAEVESAKETIVSLENAAEKLEELIQEYFSKVNKIKADYTKLLKRAVDVKYKIGEAEEFLEPTKEGITVSGFSDREKEIMKRIFYMQMYKMLDIMWSRAQLQAVPVMGERNLPNYDKVWEAFKKISGIKSNRKILGILSAIRADVRIDRDEITGIRKKSQALKIQRAELAKRYKELGEDPNKKEPILDLDKLISAVEEKEKFVKKMFTTMKQTVDLSYLSKVKGAVLSELEKTEAPKGEGEEKAPTVYAPREKVKEKDEKDIGKLVNSFEETVAEEDKKLEGVDKPTLQTSIDEILSQAEKLRNQIKLDIENIEKAKTPKQSSYKSNVLFNQKHLYGAIMKSALKEMLKQELSL